MKILNKIDTQSIYLEPRIPAPDTELVDTPSVHQDALPTIIMNMTLKKAAIFLDILKKGAAFDRQRLAALYEYGDPGFEEFKLFLQQHSIQFLGGINSKNFKVTPNDGSPSLVLKVNYRMDMPMISTIDPKGKSFQGVVTPIFAKRQISYQVNHQNIIRELLITSFCKDGDLESHSKSQKTDIDRLKSALSIYSQMASILLNISSEGYSFPDMKNSNWLIDNGKLQIADTKSFWVVRDGVIDRKNSKQLFISTHHMNPPEFYAHQFIPDKAHAFMLGKNLFQYLSGCHASYLQEKSDYYQYDFSAPLFKTREGAAFKKIIQLLLHSDPESRFSVKHALLELQKIPNHKLLDNIADFQLADDHILQQFIIAQERIIKDAITSEEILAINQELTLKLVEVEQGYIQKQKLPPTPQQNNIHHFFGNNPSKINNDAMVDEEPYQAPSTTMVDEEPYQAPSTTMVDEKPYQIPSTATVDEKPYQIPSTAMVDEKPYQIPSTAMVDEKPYQYLARQ